MKRRSNVFIWAGFAVVLAALFSYLPLFARFPLTRDLPWANILLFALGQLLVAAGIVRAFRQPEVYRGRISGIVLETLSAALFGFFLIGAFFIAKQLPPPTGAPQVGQKAPDFTLPDQNGNPVTLSKLLGTPGGTPRAPRAVVLIFYRGYW